MGLLMCIRYLRMKHRRNLPELKACLESYGYMNARPCKKGREAVMRRGGDGCRGDRHVQRWVTLATNEIPRLNPLKMQGTNLRGGQGC